MARFLAVEECAEAGVAGAAYWQSRAVGENCQPAVLAVGLNAHHAFQIHYVGTVDAHKALRIERRLRMLITRALVRQARLLSAEGKHVTIMTPGPSDLAVMGANLMDGSRRRAVLEQSLRTSAGALARIGLQAEVA